VQQPMTFLAAPKRRRDMTSAFALVGMIAASAIVRSAIAFQHTTPRYFPDEYIYAALGRSIAHGHIAIRGVSSHFPALLEPLVAAPIWALFSTGTAYHLVQIENAVAASLACLPVYLLARYLGLERRYSLACAAYSIVIPELIYTSFTTADALAYPLAAAAITVAVMSLDTPSPRRQLAFLAFAFLASAARVQYLALIVGYIAAAGVVERQRLVRAHWVVFATLSPALVAALAAGPSRILGYYSGVLSLNVGGGVVRWFLQSIYLVTLQAGGILIPGAIIALVRPIGRRGLAFCAFVSVLSIALLLEAAIYAAQGPGFFKGRYVLAIPSLVPIAFGLYLKRGRPLPGIVFGLAGIMAIAATRLPISEYANATFRSDSAFLLAAGWAEDRLGIVPVSFLVAGLVTTGLLGGVLIAYRGGGIYGILAAICFAAFTSGGAVAADVSRSREVRATLPHNLGWVDRVARAQVTAIATPGSPPAELIDQLFWNQSVQREVLLDGASPTDAFSAPGLRITPGGRLRNVSGDLLIENFGTTMVPFDAQLVASAGHFSLWRPRTIPRLRLLIEGRYSDSWLASSAGIRAWSSSGHGGVKVSFDLSLPARWPRHVVRFQLAGSAFVTRRGSHIRVMCETTGGPLNVAFSSSDFVLRGNFRVFAIRMSRLSVADSGTTTSTPAGSAHCARAGDSR
jgi:hypothetical protein